jgi:hypothetical protein
MTMKRNAISHLGIVTVAAVLLGVSVVGLYLSYSVIHLGTTTVTVTESNTISLDNFSINPATANLSGTVYVSSNSPISLMNIYLNGTYVGSLNYTGNYSMMGMMKGYPSMYFTVYSALPKTMPMMSRFPMVEGREYVVRMMATFRDGSICNASEIILAK